MDELCDRVNKKLRSTGDYSEDEGLELTNPSKTNVWSAGEISRGEHKREQEHRKYIIGNIPPTRRAMVLLMFLEQFSC